MRSCNVPKLLPLVLLAIAADAPAWATNGMYLAGYGAEADGRGGTGIAIADRALGLQFNPAGIAQLQGNHFTVDLQVLMPELHFANFQGTPIANDLDGESQEFYMPSFAYVQGAKDSPWAWGIGLVSQGGMGATFENTNTPFGTKDETTSMVRFATLTPAVAYSFNKDVSIGLSANVGWSDVRYTFWPQTSAPPGTGFNGFFGMKMSEAASTFNYSVRLGVMWRVHPIVQLGAVYQTKTHSDYSGGTLETNQSAISLGSVSYDAKVGGFTWPEQYGIGIQIRPAEKWVLAFDVKEYNWSDAIGVVNVTGTNPSNPGTPVPVFAVPFVFDWENQTVFALGGEYRASDDFTVRAGYNYGKSPVPDATLNPLFPATPEQHATVGLGWNHGANTVNFALERAFEHTQTNDNTDPNVNPFGPGATVNHSQWTISIGYSRAFGRR